MKKLNSIIFIVAIFTCSISAQTEFKTAPLNLIFKSPIPDLYIEYIGERIGVEYGFGLINNCTDFIFCDINQKGFDGLLAAKHYFVQGKHNKLLFAGLYLRTRKVEFEGDGVVLKIEDELSFGTGIMGGYKLVSKKGFLLEIALGMHTNKLIKTKKYNPEKPDDVMVRIMVGYRVKK